MLADAVAAREAFLAQLVPLVATGDVPEFFSVVAKLQATVMLPVDLSRVEALDAIGSRKGDARAHVDNLRLWRSRAVGVGDGVGLGVGVGVGVGRGVDGRGSGGPALGVHATQAAHHPCCAACPMSAVSTSR